MIDASIPTLGLELYALSAGKHRILSLQSHLETGIFRNIRNPWAIFFQEDLRPTYHLRERDYLQMPNEVLGIQRCL